MKRRLVWFTLAWLALAGCGTLLGVGEDEPPVSPDASTSADGGGPGTDAELSDAGSVPETGGDADADASGPNPCGDGGTLLFADTFTSPTLGASWTLDTALGTGDAGVEADGTLRITRSTSYGVTLTHSDVLVGAAKSVELRFSVKLTSTKRVVFAQIYDKDRTAGGLVRLEVENGFVKLMGAAGTSVVTSQIGSSVPASNITNTLGGVRLRLRLPKGTTDMLVGGFGATNQGPDHSLTGSTGLVVALGSFVDSPDNGTSGDVDTYFDDVRFCAYP